MVSFLHVFTLKPCIHFPSNPGVSHWFHPYHPPCLDHIKDTWWAVQTVMHLTIQFLHCIFNSSLLSPNISLYTLFSTSYPRSCLHVHEYPACVPPWMWQTTFCTHTKQHKKFVFCLCFHISDRKTDIMNGMAVTFPEFNLCECNFNLCCSKISEFAIFKQFISYF